MDTTQYPVLELLDEQPNDKPTTSKKATTKKGTTMTTKKNAATTKPETKKETTMPENDAPKTSGQDTIHKMIAEYDETVAALRAKHDPVDMQPVNPITGRPLNKDEKVIDDLRYFAAEYGWTDNRFATGGQIRANGGKVDKDKPSVTMFMRFGNSDKYSYYRVYNLADVTWPDGTIPTTFAVKSGKKSGKSTTAKGKKSGKSTTKTAATSAVPAAPAQLIRMTLPDGTVVEGRTVDEVIALKKALMA